jgi:hypothetical protein
MLLAHSIPFLLEPSRSSRKSSQLVLLFDSPSTTPLCAEALGLALTGRVGCGRTSHLDGNDATEGACLVAVGNLDEADVALAGHGAGASGAGGDRESHGLLGVSACVGERLFSVSMGALT